MSAFNPAYLNHTPQSKTQQQELQQLYGYYDRHSPKQQQNNQPHQEQPFFQYEQNLYDGSEYMPEPYYGEDLEFDQYSYQGSEKKEGDNDSWNSVNQRLQNSFTIKYHETERQKQYNSQPTAVNRWENSRSISSKQPGPNSSKESQNRRSIHALVSTQKRKKKIKKPPSKAVSQKSLSVSSLSSRNKLIHEHKEKKKNGDKTVEAVFFNPLASLPFEAIDVEGFQKFYKTPHSSMFQVRFLVIKKINDLQKKIIILGEKAFFKDKQNEKSMDEIFKLMGFKTSGKMGKAKSFRQFKAIYKYLNMDNPKGSGSKNSTLGDGAKMIDNSYLNQFKQLMGYQETQQQKECSSKKSLFGYGFDKLERKR